MAFFFLGCVLSSGMTVVEAIVSRPDHALRAAVPRADLRETTKFNRAQTLVNTAFVLRKRSPAAYSLAGENLTQSSKERWTFAADPLKRLCFKAYTFLGV